jgi:hypothetical protein
MYVGNLLSRLWPFHLRLFVYVTIPFTTSFRNSPFMIKAASDLLRKRLCTIMNKVPLLECSGVGDTGDSKWATLSIPFSFYRDITIISRSNVIDKRTNLKIYWKRGPGSCAQAVGAKMQ